MSKFLWFLYLSALPLTSLPLIALPLTALPLIALPLTALSLIPLPLYLPFLYTCPSSTRVYYSVSLKMDVLHLHTT